MNAVRTGGGARRSVAAPTRTPRSGPAPLPLPAGRHRRVGAVVALLLALVLAGACSSSGPSATGSGRSSGSTGSTGAASDTGSAGGSGTLRILVTNDDGYDAPGIDTLVQRLSRLDHVELTVVAPATNQSGVGGATTPGPLGHRDARTAGGHPAVAIDGHPADAVRYALDDLHLEPDLVVAGVNQGQNVGPVIDISGTVGAARAGVARGIPAVAASAGIGEPVDFATVADAVVTWVRQHRAALLDHRQPVAVTNINGPSCGGRGHVRGTVDVPPGTSGEGAAGPQDCTSTLTHPADDVQALDAGYLVVAPIPATPAGR